MSYQMTEDHKEALAEGRRDGRYVRQYLEAIQNRKPRRGRRPMTETREGIENRLAVIEEELSNGHNALQRLALTQEKLDLTQKWNELENEGEDEEELEERFVEVAASYAERKGISYQAFREMGVPANVLRRAGIQRTS